MASDLRSARSGNGMILGKFMPPHAGHRYLIDFGRHFVERLYVLVCTLDREPIPGELRWQWMNELFPHVQLIHITEDLPQEPADHPRFWEIWRNVIEQAVGEPIDYVFASESYGTRLAQELNATFVPVDLSRDQLPVSGTAIRTDPFGHWSFIPTCVRPYYVKRVCLFGPESTGKSTLANQLATSFGTVSVPEFARPWLNPKAGVCQEEDIAMIARGQAAAEDALVRQANKLLFCDTDLLLTTVWSEELFGGCEEWIRREALRRRHHLYLLLDVDVPWVDDQQRYLPHRRQEFWDRCRERLESSGCCYEVIRGPYATRYESACNIIRKRVVA